MGDKCKFPHVIKILSSTLVSLPILRSLALPEDAPLYINFTISGQSITKRSQIPGCGRKIRTVLSAKY
jgi:hypothetical protein